MGERLPSITVYVTNEPFLFVDELHSRQPNPDVLNSLVDKTSRIVDGRCSFKRPGWAADCELIDEQKWFVVTYTVMEGEPFTIGEIGIPRNTVFEDRSFARGSR